MSNHTPVKLHLGCFKKKIYGFVNIDNRADVEPDVVDDAFKLEKYKNDSVDLIYACHILEHSTQAQSKAALKRWWEVLKPGGILRICVPDLEECFNYYMETKDLDSLHSFIYGGQHYENDYHMVGWDQFTLSRDLFDAGFASVRKYDWRATEHFYIDDHSHSYLPKISYKTRSLEGTIDGRLLSLNMEATK